MLLRCLHGGHGFESGAKAGRQEQHVTAVEPKQLRFPRQHLATSSQLYSFLRREVVLCSFDDGSHLKAKGSCLSLRSKQCSLVGFLALGAWEAGFCSMDPIPRGSAGLQGCHQAEAEQQTLARTPLSKYEFAKRSSPSKHSTS